MNPDQRIQEYAAPAPVRLRVDIPRGRIAVRAGAGDKVRIVLTALRGDSAARQWIADAEIGQSGDEISVRIRQPGFSWRAMFGGEIEAAVEVPAGSAATLSTGSGKIVTEGRLGEVKASSGSGAIVLDDSGEVRARTGSGAIAIASASGSVDAKTGSGRVKVGKVGADVRIATGSGDAELAEAAGHAQVNTASGSIVIGRAGDSTDAFAASGEVRVQRADHGRVSARTLSGGVSVGVAKGTAALLDVTTVSGRVNSALDTVDAPGESDSRVELIIHTMSGNVNLARA